MKDQKENKKTEKKSSCVLGKILIAVLFFAMGAAGGYYYAQYENRDQQMCDDAWEKVADSYNSNDLRRFLEKFPDSKYQKLAKERLNKVVLLENAWADVCNSSKTTDFIDFMNRYSDAHYENLCQGKIDSLDWDRVQQDVSLESVNYYLEVHPNGKYLAEAQLYIEQFNQAAELAESKSGDIRQKMQEVFAAIGSNDMETLMPLLADRMEIFISKPHPTKAEVKEMMQRMYSSHIQACSFDIPSHLNIKLEKNGENQAFATHFLTRQHIVRDNEGKTEDMYVVDALLDEELKIISLKLSKK